MSLDDMSMEAILKRLRHLDNLRLDPQSGSSSSNSQLPQQYSQKSEEKTDPLHKNNNALSRKEFSFPDLEGVDLLRLMTGRPPVKYDFLDREWIGKPGIALDRYTTDEHIAAIGRKVIPMLSSASSFSQQDVASLFILAYHLKAPGSRFREFVFNLDPTLQVISDQRFTDLSVTPANGNHNSITATDNPTREAAVYSYIAVSLFRLFSKPESNYMKSWSHILNGFSKFYEEPMRMRLPVPTEDSLKHLKYWLCGPQERVKVTLCRFLYMSNSDERHKELKNFLYDNHLLYTGLHIVSIILQLCDVLKCSMESILTLIKTRQNEKQVKCLVHISKLRSQNDENHRKQMWRYGRIFDEAFMCDLQTKSCPKLVYMLAEALRSEEPEKHSGILHIVQLANVREDNKLECCIIAQRLLTRLKSQNPRNI